ncbi:hypothetical protein ABT010_32800 [Streptomyces sp. NPDC002668]|uniref:hypothetical protein n=1 Tax=Streptomyces sp. NPDC002668 TaxID=3154422 RepID=UPI003330E5B5
MTYFLRRFQVLGGDAFDKFGVSRAADEQHMRWLPAGRVDGQRHLRVGGEHSHLFPSIHSGLLRGRLACRQSTIRPGAADRATPRPARCTSYADALPPCSRSASHS